MYVDAYLALVGSISGNTVTGGNVFGNGTTLVSTNTVDLASGGFPTATAQTRDIGAGNDSVKLRVAVTTAAAGGTSMEFQAITTDNANLTGNVTVVGTSGAIAVASLTAGARFSVELNPRLLKNGQRYFGMQTVNVGNNTAGAIYADLGPDVEDFKTYQSGFAVL